MRSFAILALVTTALAATGPVNITKTEIVDLEAGSGSLGWGASNLAFDYEAGCGLNFNKDSVGGGFNGNGGADAPTSIGGGWNIFAENVTVGFGVVVGNKSVDFSLFADKVTGELTVKVNGKDVVL